MFVYFISVCLHLSVHHVCAVPKHQKGVSDPLDLELWTVVSLLTEPYKTFPLSCVDLRK